MVFQLHQRAAWKIRRREAVRWKRSGLRLNLLWSNEPPERLPVPLSPAGGGGVTVVWGDHAVYCFSTRRKRHSTPVLTVCGVIYGDKKKQKKKRMFRSSSENLLLVDVQTV